MLILHLEPLLAVYRVETLVLCNVGQSLPWWQDTALGRTEDSPPRSAVALGATVYVSLPLASKTANYKTVLLSKYQ